MMGETVRGFRLGCGIGAGIVAALVAVPIAACVCLLVVGSCASRSAERAAQDAEERRVVAARQLVLAERQAAEDAARVAKAAAEREAMAAAARSGYKIVADVPVRTCRETRVMIGTRTLATLAPGRDLHTVEVRGSWVKVTVEDATVEERAGRAALVGWVKTGDVYRLGLD